MSLMAELKERTRRSHEALERMEFARQLAEGTATREKYIEYLRVLEILYAELERAPLPEPAASVWVETMRRGELLARDLRALGAPERTEELSPTSAHAIVGAQQLRLDRARNPQALVGVLYVLEGSTLGGALLAKSMGATLSGVGVDYLNSYGAERGKHWKEFRSRVDALPSVSTDEAVRGALAMFELFTRVFSQLEGGESLSAHAVNPEAGTHPVTHSATELESALRAGEKSLADFPYLQARYGERGEKFTRSDSAWLITLNSHTPAAALGHVRWLGVVLASRGMPRLLLERHIRVLVDQLQADGSTADYAPLLEASGVLKAERCAVLSAQDTHELVENFRGRAPSDELDAHPDLAELLVSAVADEANGIRQAVKSFNRWVCDEKWSAEWIDAVQSTEKSARSRVRMPASAIAPSLSV